MTTENNAAQAVQESERNAAVEEYFGHRTWIKPTASNFRLFEAGFDRAYALLSKLRAEGVQAGDERAHHRNDGFSSLSLWWTMIEAEAELIGEPIKDDRPILSFMGSGASHQVTAGDIRAALASAPVAGEAVTDDMILHCWNAHVESPDDVRYFCQAIITAPGEMVAVPHLSFEIHRVDAYPTDLPGAVQHNAWWDAMALRHILQHPRTDGGGRE